CCYCCALRLSVFIVAAISEIDSLSLHDALPIYGESDEHSGRVWRTRQQQSLEASGNLRGVETSPPLTHEARRKPRLFTGSLEDRSEEHTSELQSRENLVCRLLLEK